MTNTLRLPISFRAKPAAREDDYLMAPTENLPGPGSLAITFVKPDPDYNDWVWSWPELVRGDLCKKVIVAAMML